MALRLDPATSNVSNEVIAGYAVEADRAQRDIDEATGRKRSVLKRAKAEGVKTRVLLAAIKMKRQDPDEVALEMRDSIRYVNIITPGVRLTQAELFTGEDATRPLNVKVQAEVQAWQAEAGGYADGKQGGHLNDSPHQVGTEARVHYERGWLRGQAVIANEMAPNAKKADPSRTKRRGGAVAVANVTEDEQMSGDDMFNGTGPVGNA